MILQYETYFVGEVKFIILISYIDVLIWNQIKEAASEITKAGGSRVEILIRSQGKRLEEAKRGLNGEEERYHDCLEMAKKVYHNI